MTPTGIEPATFRFVPQHLNHCANAVLSDNKNIAEKLEKDSILSTPDWPNSGAVANFRLLPGHNCLAKCLYHIGLFPLPYSSLCDDPSPFLLGCVALSLTSESQGTLVGKRSHW